MNVLQSEVSTVCSVYWKSIVLFSENDYYLIEFTEEKKKKQTRRLKTLITHQNNVAMRSPTPMQSTNIT